MKVYAHHDDDGNIHSFVTTDTPKGAGLMLTPNPGHSVSEIEGVKVNGDESDFDRLREIGATQRLSKPPARIGLTKKK